MAQLPEALHDGGGLFANTDEQGEIGVVETVEAVAVQVDNAKNLAAGFDHGRGDFAAVLLADRDVARIDGDVGDELGTTMESHPAGDALAEAQADVVGVVKKTLVNVDLQFAGVGIEQGYRAGGRAECFNADGQNRLQRLVGIVNAAGKAADAIKRPISARIRFDVHV